MRYFLAAALCAFAFSGCFPAEQGQVVLIPPGYTGEVLVEYEVRGAAPLPVEDGARVLVIPANGWLRTSSAIQTGWRPVDRLYFWDGQVRTPAASVVPGYQRLGGQNGSWGCPKNGGGSLQGEIFYLGTEAQWRATSYNGWADIGCKFLADRLRDQQAK